jgi:hypothetical protein
MGENSMMWLWQLPQHLLGLILILVFNAKIDIRYTKVRVYRTDKKIGISLGQYIIVHKLAHFTTVKHEYGHSIQSQYLGPLYLLIVGLPSITMNILTRFGVLRAYRYYDRWPENWADSLGGVRR